MLNYSALNHYNVSFIMQVQCVRLKVSLQKENDSEREFKVDHDLHGGLIQM